jgi:hypothetical protein
MAQVLGAMKSPFDQSDRGRTGNPMSFARATTDDQLPRMLAAVENAGLVFVPMALIASKQTPMITPNMTAYSIAVGPSSDRTNLFARGMNRCMACSSCLKKSKSRHRAPRSVGFRAKLQGILRTEPMAPRMTAETAAKHSAPWSMINADKQSCCKTATHALGKTEN